MKKILFLPFLSIPSGHHQVASALMERLDENFDCEKIDILSFSYGKIETVVSHTYLKWIKILPGMYHWIYQESVYRNREKEKRYRLYELLFVPFMRKLINEINPDLIVCTHALPSYMLNCLKEKSEIATPVINVYTDYFIHDFWGMKQVDYHFVPSQRMKQFLIQKGVNDNRIYVTGIPVHHDIKKQVKFELPGQTDKLSVLLSGGNMGVGAIEDVITAIGDNRKLQLHVLCGKNKRLYQRLKKSQHITAYPFISSRKEMDQLYQRVDAILTKPGGVTISECLFKQKPIFIYHALPGQEKINVDMLNELGVIVDLQDQSKHILVEQLLSILEDKQQLRQMEQQLANYHKQLVEIEPHQLIERIVAD